MQRAFEIRVGAGISWLCGRHGRLYTSRVIKGRPPRLDQIFQSYDSPVFFVTFCTVHRIKIERLDIVHTGWRNTRYGPAMNSTSRLVATSSCRITFICLSKAILASVSSHGLSGLKRAISVFVRRNYGQASLATRLLRSLACATTKATPQKWEYVRDNPVRHGLVASAEEWPYQGEIVLIDRV